MKKKSPGLLEHKVLRDDLSALQRVADLQGGEVDCCGVSTLSRIVPLVISKRGGGGGGGITENLKTIVGEKIDSNLRNLS